VILITGYPSVPSAASAVRLGASDYVTKPFTPEEITRSVQRVLPRHHAWAMLEAGAGPWLARAGESRFLDQSWLQLGGEQWVRVGAVLAHSQTATGKAVRLPGVGDVVYQGLPLAALALADDSLIVIPAPLSGVVVSVNDLLGEEPSRLLADPCGEGWIACVCTTRFDDEIERCRPRHVILASASPSDAAGQSGQLSALGCRVDVVKDYEELALAVRDAGHQALLLDAASFDALGPELVRKVNADVPSLKVVVIGCSDARWEAAYREHKIFYYAVEPFADNEIIEILNAVFPSPVPVLRQPERAKGWPAPFTGIGVTHPGGGTAQLLAEPGLLSEGEGLGGHIVQGLADQGFRVRTTRGEQAVTPGAVLKAVGTHDRVTVLRAKDAGRLPGTLTQDTTAEYVSAAGLSAGKVATLVVQPGPAGPDLAGLDDRTVAFLAEHVVREMTSC